MKKYKDKKQYRLPYFDYAQDGYYYITICTKDRKYLFGEIENQKMKLSVIGKIAQKHWKEIPDHFDYVFLDKFVFMPDHMHGIIGIRKKYDFGTYAKPRRDGEFTVPTGLQPQKKSLSTIIRDYKGAVTRYCRANNLACNIWQPRFHDHIIRNEKDLQRIQQYILLNPMKWKENKY